MRNFKLLFLLMLGMFVVLQSCEKKGLQTEKEKVIAEVGVSEINDEYAGQFKQEFTVSDNNGNTAFYVAYSNDENELNEFVKNTEFSLTTNDVDIEAMKNIEISSSTKQTTKSNNINDDGITIELIYTNFNKSINNFSLSVKNNSKTKEYGSHKYKTTNDFIGVIKKTGNLLVQLGHKNCWLCSWDWDGILLNVPYNDYDPFGNPILREGIGHSKSDYDDVYKIGIFVSSTNESYDIVYDINNFRGSYCTIGRYDGANCKVGTPPAGTNAFMWPTNTGNFYYSPRSYGNKCPYPGSWFDGANCYVCDIPNYTTTNGFIWRNNWYVKAEIIGSGYDQDPI